MVGYIQKNIRKFSIVLWIVVAAFVGTIFLVWGRGSLVNLSGNYVAKVGDVEISIREFERTYSNMLDIYRNIYKDKFSMDLVRSLGLKEQALSHLINNAVVLNIALKEGFEVSPQEIAEALSSVKAFQVNGKFNVERYKEVLRLNGYTPVEFEKRLYNEILRRKLEGVVKGSVVLTTEEARIFARGLLQKAKIAYFTANLSDFAEMAEVSEEEARKFYNEHRELFRTEPQLELQYVLITPSQFKDKILVTREEIEQFYKENPDLFMDKEGKVKPLKDVEKEIISRLKKEKAHKEALRYALKLQREMAGSTMEKVCKKEGIPIIRIPLSPVSSIKLPDEVKDKALKAPEDTPTEVIKTDKGFYIVVVTRKIPSRIPSFEEVKDEAIKRVKLEKTPHAAEKWASRIIKQKDRLQTIVNKMGLKYSVKESGYFTREGVKLGKEIYKRLAYKALQIKPHQKGYVIEKGRLIVFEVLDLKEPEEKEIKAKIKELTPFLMANKREKVWSSFVKEARERTEIKINQKVWEAFR